MPKLNRTQQAVAGVIYILSGIVVVLLLVSFVFRLFGSDELGISRFFSAPFRGIFSDASIGQGSVSVYLMVAMLFYPLLAYIVMLFITSLLVLNPLRIVRGIVNALFRFVELVLVTRFLFKVFAASIQSSFVTFIYKSTNFIPSTLSFIPTIRFSNSEFELSTFFVFGIILIIDILVWNLFTSLLEDRNYD